jgi:hypothetical protein
MSSNTYSSDTKLRLLETHGHDKREIIVADSWEELIEKAKAKGGVR